MKFRLDKGNTYSIFGGHRSDGTHVSPMCHPCVTSNTQQVEYYYYYYYYVGTKSDLRRAR